MKVTICVLLALSAATPGCSTNERTNPMDQKGCDPACDERKLCIKGKCEADPCPVEMVYVPSPVKVSGYGEKISRDSVESPFCIDRFEMSGPLPAAAGKTSLVGLTIAEARATCRAVSKQLCTREQWNSACVGQFGDTQNEGKKEAYRGPGADQCNTNGHASSPQLTGANASCEGGYTGLFDMIGNVAEWVMVCDPLNATKCDGGGAGKFKKKIYSADLPRGGSYNTKLIHDTSVCLYNVHGDTQNISIETVQADAGVRCCRPCETSATKATQCKAGPQWFDHSDYLGVKDIDHLVVKDMWGASATDIWAVMMVSSNKNYNPVLFRFNGQKWIRVKMTFAPAETGSGEINISIWGTSDKNVLIAYDKNIYQWDGATWTHDSTSFTNIQGIYATSATDVWIINNADGNTVRKKSATGWDKQFVGGDVLRDMWGASATDIWAVGNSGTCYRTTVTGWDKCSLATSENLVAVWGSSASDMWSLTDSNQIHRFDFKDTGGWVPYGFAKASAIGGTSATDIWIISDKNAIEHFDGTTWTLKIELKNQNTNSFFDRLTPIRAFSPTDVWFGAVRYH